MSRTTFELESSYPEPNNESVHISSKDWQEGLQEEIDRYYEIMKTFNNGELNPTEIFLYLSGWTARMSEVRGQLYRSNSNRSSQFRIREIEPFIAECERQFKYHSRRFSNMEFDLKLER